MAEPGDRAVPDRKAGSGESGASRALDFEPVTRKKGSQNLNLKLFFTLVALTVVGGGGAWYFYGQRSAGDDDATPLIRAAVGPVKVRPDNPGGMVVPDRDKLVYDRMQGLENRPVERLLPAPEIPLAPPGAKTLEKAVSAPAATPPPVTPPPEPAPEPAARPTVAEVLAAKPPSPPPPALEAVVKKMERKEAAKPKAEKEAATPQPAKAKPETLMARAAKPPKVPDSVYRVQLAAVRTPERAREEWARLQKKHSTLLGQLTMSLTRADLGAKGVFYRLRAGPLATESAARGLCGELAKRKVGCMIIRPEK